MWRTLPVAAIVWSVAGCMSPAEREAHYVARCESMGVPQGDPRFYDCRLRVEALEKAERQSIAEGLRRAGEEIDQANTENRLRKLENDATMNRIHSFGRLP